MTGQQNILSESGVQVKGMLTTSSKLPYRDAIMKSKANKKALVRVLSHTILATT